MIRNCKDSLGRGLNKREELKIENYFIKTFYHEYPWMTCLAPLHLGIIYGRPLTNNVTFVYYSGLRREGLVGLVLLLCERVEFV